MFIFLSRKKEKKNEKDYHLTPLDKEVQECKGMVYREVLHILLIIVEKKKVLSFQKFIFLKPFLYTY